MTNSQETNTASNTDTPRPDDPRYGLALVANKVGDLMAATPDSALGNHTPCDEFTVKELNEHLVMVMGRVGAIGRGEHWSTIDQLPQDSGWAEAFKAAADQATEAWADASKLGETYEVPWGEMPGVPMIMTYTGELAVHGWDLATAIGAEFTIEEEDILRGPLECVRFVPAEGRDAPEVPFGPVVDVGPEASVLHQLAGWAGRNVLG